jgi:dTDP-4-dehydrorhamnose reductase
VLGLNSYLTSERFLDHRFTRYPEHVRGGNGSMRYADVEAVRVADPGPLGRRAAARADVGALRHPRSR